MKTRLFDRIIFKSVNPMHPVAENGDEEKRFTIFLHVHFEFQSTLTEHFTIFL